jgi:hypothetical protein
MTRPMTIKENYAELPMEMSKNIQTKLARKHLLYGFSVLATTKLPPLNVFSMLITS